MKKLKKSYGAAAVLACAMALIATGCANDDTTFNGKVETNLVANVGKGSIGLPAETRTSLSLNLTSGTANALTFPWEEGDKLYLPTADGVKEAVLYNLTSDKKLGTFNFGDVQIQPSYILYYNGSAGLSYNNVLISTTQTQAKPNDGGHIGRSGDCGIALASTATRNSDGGYNFVVNHKSSYVAFLPYNQAQPNGETSVKKITVTTTDGSNIAGNYTLAANGSLTGGSAQGVTLNLNGNYPVYGNLAQDKNAAYLVIAPGVHSVKITYTLADGSTVEKQHDNINFLAGNFVGFADDLGDNALVFGYGYHVWDAKKNMWEDGNNVWRGNLLQLISPYGYNAKMGLAYNLDKDNPVLEEAVWYLKNGDPHWDGNQKWVMNGVSGKGGLWLKKRNGSSEPYPIHNFTRKTTYTSRDYGTYMVDGRPSDTSKYFFLPAAGYYAGSKTLYQAGETGYYWLRNPNGMGKAFVLSYTAYTTKTSNLAARQFTVTGDWYKKNSALPNWIGY